MKKLSIITVCLNEFETVEKTLTSVYEQTFSDYEHIIIDGGSTDGTLEIVNRFSDNIEKVVSEPDKGIFDAMNKGIELANGEYLFFLNSGDYIISKDALERMFSQEPTADVVYCDGAISLGRGVIAIKPSPQKIGKAFMFMDTIPHQNSFVKKSLFNQIGKFNLDYKIAADYEFFLRALYEYGADAEYIEGALTVNNVLGVSSDLRNRRQSYSERAKAQKRYFSGKTYKFFRIAKPFIYYLYKYPKYLLYIIKSFFSRNKEGRKK